MKRIGGWILAVLMILSAGISLAELSYEGTVVAGETVPIQVGFGGKISGSKKRAGDLVTEGEVLAEIKTTLHYAPVEGTLSGLYIEDGDKAEDVTERYGASL